MPEQNLDNNQDPDQTTFSDEDLAKAKRTTIILYVIMGLMVGAPIVALIFLK